jgi:hypothetical protein
VENSQKAGTILESSRRQGAVHALADIPTSLQDHRTTTLTVMDEYPRTPRTERANGLCREPLSVQTVQVRNNYRMTRVQMKYMDPNSLPLLPTSPLRLPGEYVSRNPVPQFPVCKTYNSNEVK